MFKKVLILTFFLNYFFIPRVVPIELDISNVLTQKKEEIEPKNTLYIELINGVVIAELFPKIAPRHVQRIKSLVKDGFYDGLKFHRVITGFMAQTGDPTGTGRGGSSYGKLTAEFSKEHHIRGTLSMARASDPNSANSQFFIVTGEYFPELDNQYTIFGRVIEGMEYVDKIKSGDTEKNGIVENPDIMIKVLTGDMLNNKSLSTIKKEIKLIEEIQNEEKQENPDYERKSILKILYASKDIDSTNDEIVEEKKEENNKIDNNNKIVAKEIETNKKNKEQIKNEEKNTENILNKKVNTEIQTNFSTEEVKKEIKKTEEEIKKSLSDIGINIDKIKKDANLTDEELKEFEKNLKNIN